MEGSLAQAEGAKQGVVESAGQFRECMEVRWMDRLEGA